MSEVHVSMTRLRTLLDFGPTLEVSGLRERHNTVFLLWYKYVAMRQSKIVTIKEQGF